MERTDRAGHRQAWQGWTGQRTFRPSRTTSSRRVPRGAAQTDEGKQTDLIMM